ncbi:MAG: FCD domain-containing protein [Chloroflexi bacterium]|nr:FCD domain-containing protein [Chloroflexota bacterium]
MNSAITILDEGAFHRAVLEPGLDPWRTRLLGMLWQSAERYARLRTLVFDSPENVIRDHRSILAAALRRDPAVVADALTSHLERTEEIVLAGYGRVLREEERTHGVEASAGAVDGDSLR